MKNKKMIVVDLDGTLLNINGVCSKKTKKYLKKLKDMGYIVVIATGRVLRSAVNITDGAEFANYVIANAGALIYDMDNYKIIKKNEIPKNEIRRICDNYNDEIRYINICDLYYHNRCFGNDNINSCFDKRINNIDKFISDCEDVLHITVKLKDNDLVDKYYKVLDSDKIDIIVMQDSFTDKQWLEIFSKGVSKYNAIKVISEIENINNSDIISFGDGLNDIDMIKLSGVGVAMGNALDDVKDVSDYVTISHNEDGVIYFLKGYLDRDNLVS